jgi:hypothetical protein
VSSPADPLSFLRRRLPPWALSRLADTDRFLGALRGLSKATILAVLLTATVIHALKAVLVLLLVLLLAAFWLLEHLTTPPIGGTACPSPTPALTPPPPR